MHGCSLGNAPLVNAEVDSMGGVVDSGLGNGVISSPHRVAIENAQAELRREYDVREERRRELEFLEKGGNPLDFKFGNVASISVQSTSLTDQPPEQPVTSEAKGSFALTASLRGDSVESSGKPEAPVISEPNCADNLLLFDVENDSINGGKKSHLDSSQNAKGSGETAIFGLPKNRAYKRRNRSRPNRDGARSSSTDVEIREDPKSCLNNNSKNKISNGIVAPTDLPSKGVVDMVLDNGQAIESNTGATEHFVPKLVTDGEKKLVNSLSLEGVGNDKEPSAAASEFPEYENKSDSVQQNGFRDTKGDEETVQNEGQNCSETCLSLDQISDSVPINGFRSDDLSKKSGVKNLIPSVSMDMEIDENEKANDENKTDHRNSLAQDECKSGLQEEMKHIISVNNASEIEKEPGKELPDNLDPGKEIISVDKLAHDNSISEKENDSNGRPQDASVPELLSQTGSLSKDSSDSNKHKISTETQLKLDVRAHEDSILKEARIIEAKRKRIAQLSVGAFTSESCQKSHWDFLLEEMAWLANDFAQERLWKLSASAQLSHRIASSFRERLAEKSSLCEQKKVAHTLSKAVMGFWLSAEDLKKCTATQLPLSNSVRGVQEYAVRYLNYNIALVPLCLAEAPTTPERDYEWGSQELSWEEQFTEENLFYTVPPGAMEAYRKAIESHVAQVERTGNSIQEEVETSLYDAAAGNAFEEDEGETSTYHMSGDVETGKPSKFAQKKRNLIKSPSARSYDMGSNPPFMPRMENKFGTQNSVLTIKRPTNNIHVSSIPTKRMRTASRPRFTAPSGAGTSTSFQVPNKTEFSSGDNNSFQDDQSTFLGGSQLPDNMEVESMTDFERQPFDSAEVSKPKKKKKSKHLGSAYEQRWQHGNDFQNELGGYPRKRFDKSIESNGSSSMFGQPIIKKQKMMRQPMDNSLDNYNPLAGSVPSPVASQMSNMANSSKLVKILGGGNRGKKSKLLKMPVGQTGPGSPWSSFEEQALIVLVHDLGPNWELISDAINNILQYKCIFRKPKECSEHHKVLISRTAGDGADSADDSGSSQPYPSTLPGIPKGSARALFQRLQEPIEEDMIKVHFEKIILMSQKQHYRKMQSENQEQKPIQPHSSHAIALSQVCPNNINGGPILTPLDLCDTTTSSPDVISGGYPGNHGVGLTIPNNGGATSFSSANSSLQGSPNMVLGNNLSSPSAPVSSSMRDGRYGMPRSASLSTDELKRMQQYNQIMPGRVSGTPPSGTDRGVRMMAGGNGMGIMCGINRNNINMTRPGFPGIAPASVLNSGTMLPSNMTNLTEPANLHPGAGSGSGSLVSRPRDSMNMMRPAQHQRQIMVPDHQMQATQGIVSPPFVGNFSNQASPPPLSQPHPFHPHQSSPQHSHNNNINNNNNNNPHLHSIQGPNHASTPQHQAYAIRLSKERHLVQQRLLHQQQQQLAAAASSNSIMPRGQPPPPSVSAPLTPSSSTQKPNIGLTKNLQTGKQRQKQSQQQPHPGRNHPQQRPHPQQNNNTKIIKGAARGNNNMPTLQQSLPADPSVLNGISPTIEKAENMMQGKGVYPVSEINPHQQRLYSGPVVTSSSKQTQDNSIQGCASPSTSGNNNNNLPTSNQSAASPSVPSSSNSANQSLPSVQRVAQQNRNLNSESSSTKLLADKNRSEQLHASNISSLQSGTQWNAPEENKNNILPKPTKIGNQLPVTKPTEALQLQTSSSSPPQLEQQKLPAEQLQAGNSNLCANIKSTDNRME